MPSISGNKEGFHVPNRTQSPVNSLDDKGRQVQSQPKLEDAHSILDRQALVIEDMAKKRIGSLQPSNQANFQQRSVQLIKHNDVSFLTRAGRAILSLFYAIWSCITLSIFNSEQNWRQYEKYHYLCDQTLKGIQNVLSQSVSAYTVDEQQKMKEFVEKSLDPCVEIEEPDSNAPSNHWCQYYLQRAFQDLASASSAKLGSDCRSMYKSFLSNLRAAMATDDYREQNSLQFKLANEICYAIYTQSNMANFTQSLVNYVAGQPPLHINNELLGARQAQLTAESMMHFAVRERQRDSSVDKDKSSNQLQTTAKVGQGNSDKITLSEDDEWREKSNFSRKVDPSIEMDLDDAGNDTADKSVNHLERIELALRNIYPLFQQISRSSYSRRIHPLSKVGQSIRGEFQGLGFDPHMQGNPPYRKFDVTTKEGKVIGNLRLPTPTIGSEINPEFKGYLRALKARGQRHMYVNLQQIRGGNSGENQRSNLLQRLGEDPEFSPALSVVTLDKNSKFYAQSGDFEKLSNSKDFKSQFLEQVFSKDKGFYIPDQVGNTSRESLRQDIEKIFNGIHENIFNGKQTLELHERQSFIEVAYTLMIDYFVEKSGASFYNNSCKDCIDRGGGANALMFYTLTTLADPKREQHIIRNLELLPAMTHADAIWARKREIIGERLERTLGATQTLLEVMYSKPSTLAWLRSQMYFQSAGIEAGACQTIKTTDTFDLKP